jgi:hypothetical protein
VALVHEQLLLGCLGVAVRDDLGVLREGCSVRSPRSAQDAARSRRVVASQPGKADPGS